MGLRDFASKPWAVRTPEQQSCGTGAHLVGQSDQKFRKQGSDYSRLQAGNFRALATTTDVKAEDAEDRGMDSPPNYRLTWIFTPEHLLSDPRSAHLSPCPGHEVRLPSPQMGSSASLVGTTHAQVLFMFFPQGQSQSWTTCLLRRCCRWPKLC